MTDEQGKPLAEAKGEIDYAASFFEWFSGEAERIDGQWLPAIKADKRVLVLRQPVGVTAAITPWNFPAAMMTRKLGPALAAGCPMIVKPASQTPLTALEIAKLLEQAGVPEGRREHGHHPPHAASSRRPSSPTRAIRKLSFTGSTEVGKELIRASADQVKRLSLELGGHAPFVVFDDADLEAAIDGHDRLEVPQRRPDLHLREPHLRPARHPRRVHQGPGPQGDRARRRPGPQARRRHRPAHRRERRREGRGARQGRPGTRRASCSSAASGSAARSSTRGTFFAPTLLDGVTQDMLITHEETFGPVAGVTVFDTEDDAVRLANDTVFGLASYFYTRDYARLLRVAERLEYGIVGANDALPSLRGAPFGGVKESGYGREGGAAGHRRVPRRQVRLHRGRRPPRDSARPLTHMLPCARVAFGGAGRRNDMIPMPELRTLRGSAAARELLSRFRNVAIVGLSDDPSRPSYAVGHYLVAQGYRVTPVNPNIDSVFGMQSVPALDDVPHALEIVNVFRRREEIPTVVDDAIAVGALAIWLQLGLADNASETRARAAGLAVVRNRCIKVEHRAWFGTRTRVEQWRAELESDG